MAVLFFSGSMQNGDWFFLPSTIIYGIFIGIVSSACAQFNLVQVKNMTAMGNHKLQTCLNPIELSCLSDADSNITVTFLTTSLFVCNIV
jgi:hypothetical protein